MNGKRNLSLILFRHGKSDWASDYKDDRDRPLAQRGMRAARTMGTFLYATGQVPQLALSSPARRARDTLDLARRQGNWNCPVQVKNALYMATPEDVLALLKDLDGAPASLLVAGHEPTCSDLCAYLMGGTVNIRFPTGTMACLDLRVSKWSQIGFGQAELRWLVPPKLFRRDGNLLSCNDDHD
jgi:phosphohistidine phosphatase